MHGNLKRAMSRTGSKTLWETSAASVLQLLGVCQAASSPYYGRVGQLESLSIRKPPATKKKKMATLAALVLRYIENAFQSRSTHLDGRRYEPATWTLAIGERARH